MSPWIQHVKFFAKVKGMKYNEALKSSECKNSSPLTLTLHPPIRPFFTIVAEPYRPVELILINIL